MINLIRIIITLILPLIGAKGIYFADFDYVVCNDPITCVHEHGHQLDFRLGEPSQTDEFKQAVNEVLPILLIRNSCIIKSEACDYYEAYAQLWTAVNGNINDIPVEFIEFYKEK